MTLYYYAQARSYDPRAGRFTGEDIVRGQLVYPDSINHYLYCYNMPMVLADRNGKNPGIVFAPLLANPVVLGLVVAIVVVVLINLIIPHKPVSIPRIEIFPDSRKEDNKEVAPIVFLIHVLGGYINELEIYAADGAEIKTDMISLENLEYVIDPSVQI